MVRRSTAALTEQASAPRRVSSASARSPGASLIGARADRGRPPAAPECGEARGD